MIDYTELLSEKCTPEIVEMVTENNLYGKAAQYWPLPAPRLVDTSPACRSAIVGYYSPDISAASSARLLETYTKEATICSDAHSPETVERIREAASRISDAPKLPNVFFSMLIRNEIDLRDDLKHRFPEGSAPGNYKSTDDLFIYHLYLAHYGDPDAFDWLANSVAMIKGPQETIRALEALENLKIENRDRIFRTYVDDHRQTLSLSGTPGYKVSGFARYFLGIPEHDGRGRIMNEKGEPIPHKEFDGGPWVTQ